MDDGPEVSSAASRDVELRDISAGERGLFRTVSAWGIEGIFRDAADLGEPGFYVVVTTFEGYFTAVRMRHVEEHPGEPWKFARALCQTKRADRRTRHYVGRDSPDAGVWTSSLNQHGYEAGVASVRAHIAAGDVYQVNLCRVLSRQGKADLDSLFGGILERNPAPYACRVDIREADLDVASASPELFLSRNGDRLTSAPIKGTAITADAMLEKDATENIMITDLVRNDLQRVSQAGTVAVNDLLNLEQHPGLVHLVSTVEGELAPHVGWSEIFNATFPPGSVSGAPKSSALDVIQELENTDRGPYCGAIGWIDTRRDSAELAVGIRTFWQDGVRDKAPPNTLGSKCLHFGTGAGITWDSDPRGEWDETDLKARRLLQIADAAFEERS